MFTGLIEDRGTVVALARSGAAATLTVSTNLPLHEVRIGDSIAVNGACLTVTSRSGAQLCFDVSPESLSCTTLGALKSGTPVNLERALQLGDRLGGHIVTGHVDCIARIATINESAGNRIIHVSLPTENARYLIPKGSVTINGISLTVNSVSDSGFSVNIIPHTGSVTTIALLKTGDQVNIETDIIGKYVERLTAPWQRNGQLTMQTLAENGFL